MTNTAEVRRMTSDGLPVEFEQLFAPVTEQIVRCRLVIEPTSTHDPRTGRQRIDAKVTLPPDATVTVADRLIIDEEEWQIIGLSRLARRGQLVAVQARVFRIDR